MSSSTSLSKYLLFKLDNEEYGINILRIKEIIQFIPLSPIPDAPSFVKGVINLRKEVITIVDLRSKFGFPEVAYTNRTCILIVEVCTPSMLTCWSEKECTKSDCPAYSSHDRQCWQIEGTLCRDEVQGSYYKKIEDCKECLFYKQAFTASQIMKVGFIVDAVMGVLSVDSAAIDKSMFSVDKRDSAVDYILGLAKTGETFKILIDSEKVIGEVENELVFSS